MYDEEIKGSSKGIFIGACIAILVSILVAVAFFGFLEEDNEKQEEVLFEEDKTPPTITIISPEENALLEEKIRIKVDANDDESEVQISISIDGKIKKSDLKDYYNWDTTTVEDGEHNIEVTAMDTSGNQATDSIIVKTDNTPNKLPEITIDYPSSGTIVCDSVKIEGGANDDGKIEKVEVKIGNEWNIAIDESGDWYEWSYNWETSGEGNREIIAKVIDNEGGEAQKKITVVVDNNPPLIDITSPENNAILSGEIEIKTEITDNSQLDKVEIFVDSDLVYSGDANSFKLNTENYEDGNHIIKVIVTDIVGNSETSIINIGIDNTPPVLIIENPEKFSFVKGTVLIEVNSYDDNEITDMDFYIDEEFVEKGQEYEWNTLIYSDGEHEIKVESTDVIGNKIEEKITVNVDNTGPTIELIEPQAQSWVNDVIQIKTNFNDDGSGVEYISFYVDGNNNQNGTDDSFDWNTNQVSNGEHEIVIVCADKIGNENSISIPLNVDNSPPTFDISTLENNQFVNDIITIQVINIYDAGSGSDFTDSISFFIDDELIMTSEPAFNNIAECELDTKVYNDGEYDINVEIVDRLGNKKEDSVTINIDNTQPTIEITSPKEGEIIAGEVKIETYVNDEGSGVNEIRCNVNILEPPLEMEKNGDFYTFDLFTPKYIEGDHNLIIWVDDYVGNHIEVQLNLTFDNMGPLIEILEPRENSKVHDLASIEVDVDDANEIDYIEFFIDDVSVQKGDKETYGWDTTEYDELEHEITIIAEDIIGNQNEKSITIIVDNLNPLHVDIIEPHNDEAIRGNKRIKVEVETGEGAEIDYISFYIDGKLKQNSTQKNYIWNTKSFSNDKHSIKVESGDTHGNINDQTIDVYVDNLNPTIVIINPIDDEIVTDQITIEVDAEDQHSGIKYIDFQIDEISIQNDTMLNCALNTNDFNDGEHEIKVFICDKAGNMKNDKITILVDNTPPTIDIINPTSEWVKGTIEIEMDIVEEGSGIDYIDFIIEGESKQNSTKETFSWDTTAYTDGGEYDIEVKVGDKVGNSDNSSKVVGIDNTPPSLEITSPTNSDPYVKGTFRIETNALDTGSGLDNMTFKIDDTEMQMSLKQWYDWATTDYNDGNHEVNVQAKDKVGNSVIKIVDAFVDNTLPSVLITYPENDDELEDDTDEHIDANAQDDQSGLEDVEFYIDHVLQYTDPNAPFRFDFNTGDYTNGWYDIDVYSYDRAGNRAEQTIRVKIGDIDEPIIQDPLTNFLGNGYNVGNAERINVNDYSQIPVISSIIKRGITSSLGWDGSANPKDTFDVPGADQYSKYSGKMALAYWNNPEKAIVVDNYAHALLISQYAAVKDYPIIVYQGNKQLTDEALYKLDTVWPNQIIVCGNTPYNTQGVSVIDENDIQQFTIDAAKFEGYDLDYIAVVNPNDSSANTAYLSAFGGAYAATHNGIIIACDANGNQMNTRIHNAIDLLDANEIVTKHICIVGDHISLPMIYESHGGGNTPSDNRYADLDGDVTTIEISIGRVFGKELSDMSYYLDRVINYLDYHDNSLIRLQRLLDPFGWRNNAVIYMGIAAEFAEDSENHCREYMWAMGQFNTQDDTGDAHMVNTPKLMLDFSMSNYIIINADHGMPTGTMTFSSSDIPDLHPSISFGVSCSVGRVDGVNKDNSLTYTFLEKGAMAWLAPTRTAYGSFVQTYPYQPIAAPGLCWLYLRELIDNDLTSGEAYMNAKNRLISEGIGGNVNELTTWQYQHYGDPAFNPYEPNHEGMP